MRYYRIVITKNDGTTAREYTSLLANGMSNPSALNIELDVPVITYATPAGSALVRVWGISLRDIGSAADLNDLQIAIYGGMAKGLPLANPAQSGLLVKGQIFQAFGNWIGTDQTLDLIITPSTGTPDAPRNLVLNWPAGSSLETAIRSSLTVAFPGVPLKIAISDKLVLQHAEVGYQSTLSQFADLVRRLSRSILGGDYRGVEIAYNGNEIVVSDGTTPPTAKRIAPQDLIGQPTWIEPLTIQCKLVMRADLEVLGTVELPPTIIQTGQSSFSRFRDKTTFTGKYSIIYMRHIGNFRQPDAASWNTTINLVPLFEGSGQF
ncbi:MAG: hypothetical protein WDN25_13440 [Acetobacteraceae bacterium]